MIKQKSIVLFAVASLMVFYSCSPPSAGHPGSEYMPDMAHSTAYEANYYDYYYYNTWGSEDEYYKMAQPRIPVKGTIPRGYAGIHYASGEDAKMKVMKSLIGAGSTNGIAVPINGSVPYYYADTEEERLRATAELIDNPYPITDAGMADAAGLYDIYCGICHGKKGDGNGYLVAEENPNQVYPAQPASFITEEFVAASNGRYYHAIMHGKNVMGGYADKLSYEERWQVIHYIRSLQAKATKTVYTQTKNTLNAIDRPAGNGPIFADRLNNATTSSLHGGHSDGGHGGSHSTHDSHGTSHDSHGTHNTHGTHDAGHDAHGTGHDTHGAVEGDHGTHGTQEGGIIKKTVDHAGEAVDNAADAVKDAGKAVGGAVDKAGEKAGKGLNKLKDGIKKTVDKVEEKASDLKDKIKGHDGGH